jgi:Tfp pilus assembly protein PilF
MPEIHSSYLKRALMAVALLAAIAMTARAQSNLFQIDGLLVAPTGRPHCGFCRVQLEDQLGASGSVLTDGNGEFTFRNLKSGVYRIRFSRTEYEDVTMTVSLNSEITHVTIDLKLRKPGEGAWTGNGLVVSAKSSMEFQSKEAIDLYKKASKNRLKNKIDQAMPQYESLIQKAPSFYSAHLDLGMTYQMAGRLDDAQREFQTAHLLEAAIAEPFVHLSEVYILRNEWTAAIAASTDAIQRDPHSADAFLNLGLALYCSGLFDLARDSLKKALNSEPKLAEANLLLINVYLQFHDWHDAREQIDRYLTENPSKVASRSTLSALRTQLRKGDVVKDDLQVPFPTHLGFTVRNGACRDN